jgi:hypothetical protein
MRRELRLLPRSELFDNQLSNAATINSDPGILGSPKLADDETSLAILFVDSYDLVRAVHFGLRG